jgi:hypothetical protein
MTITLTDGELWLAGICFIAACIMIVEVSK